MHGGIQNAMLIREDPTYMRQLPASRIVESHAAFDLPFLIRGMVEMSLQRTGFRRRTGLDTLTPQGDERGHTAEKGLAYVSALRQTPLPQATLPESSYSLQVLEKFLVRARERGVTVIGGLPTVPESTPIDERSVARIRRLFESSGQRFVSTAGYSRYPLSCFFDAPYHLHEACQIEHSRAIAQLIQATLASRDGR